MCNVNISIVKNYSEHGGNTMAKGYKRQELETLNNIAMRWYGVPYTKLDCERQGGVYYYAKVEKLI